MDTYPNIDFSQINQADNMQPETLRILDGMLQYATNILGWKYHINSSYRAGDKKSHGKGEAIDMYFYKDSPGDIPLIDQLMFAMQFNWRGFGYYPHWNTPGIHIDNRSGDDWVTRKPIWRRNKKGSYEVGYLDVMNSLTA